MSERLFLLEVYVENLHIDNCQNLGVKFKQACVKFKFLNYPFLELLEDVQCRELAPDDKCDIQFASGKSCLFALRSTGTEPRPNLDLDLSAYVLPDKGDLKLVGTTSIGLAGSFSNLVNMSKNNEVYTSPLTKTLRNKYKLKNGQKEVGSVTVFARLSCFGRIIVTQFQMSGEENKSFLFKAVSDVQCKMFEGGDLPEATSSARPLQEESAVSMAKSAMSEKRAPCAAPQGPTMTGGGIMPGMWPPPGNSNWMPQMSPMGPVGMGMGSSMAQGGATPQVADSLNYRVIHVDVNGHQMQVKVLRKQGKDLKSKNTSAGSGPRYNVRTTESNYSTCSSGITK